MEFSKFKVRFVSKCKCCSKSVEVGETTYGAKDDSGKWTIVCQDCYLSGDYKKIVETLKDETLESVINSLPPKDRFTDGIDGVGSIEDSPIKMDIELPEEPLTFEEKIKRNAKWYIV